ncbi:MAG: hypothetical protein KF781_08930 [Chitinophagaceae bacterium]|nr:hypothetical protein [Chitinophagaceae bacterium]MCW5905061.1 hypothetical protein [Chitinophagaceae bacterium]
MKKIIIAGIVTVIMIIVLRYFSVGLVTDYSPMGIVSFELAKNMKDAYAIMAAVGIKPLQINIAVDFAFIIAYCLFLFLCCKALMSKYNTNTGKTIGLIFLELSVLVGVLDLVENIAMLITLGGYGSNISISISRWSAIIKFSLAALVILYILSMSLYFLLLSKKKS